MCSGWIGWALVRLVGGFVCHLGRYVGCHTGVAGDQLVDTYVKSI